LQVQSPVTWCWAAFHSTGAQSADAGAHRQGKGRSSLSLEEKSSLGCCPLSAHLSSCLAHHTKGRALEG
jgi:hypothetical protein